MVADRARPLFGNVQNQPVSFFLFQEDFPHRGIPQVEHLKLGGKTLEQCYTPVLRCGLC